MWIQRELQFCCQNIWLISYNFEILLSVLDAGITHILLSATDTSSMSYRFWMYRNVRFCRILPRLHKKSVYFLILEFAVKCTSFELFGDLTIFDITNVGFCRVLLRMNKKATHYLTFVFCCHQCIISYNIIYMCKHLTDC